MPLIKAIDLADKRVRIRRGYDGYEPLDVLQEAKRRGKSQLAVVLECDYPGVLIDGYTNRAILATVQDALAAIGLHVVIKDVYDPPGVVPEEERGTLVESEDYLLVDEALVERGALLLWSSTLCYAGPFYYETNLTVDVIVGTESMEALASALRDLCQERGIEVEVFADATTDPGVFLKQRGIPGFLRKAASFLRRIGGRSAPSCKNTGQ